MPLSRLFLTLAAAAVAATAGAADNKKLLLVTDSGGFIHDSVGVAEDVLKEIGPKNGYDVTCYRFTRDPDAKVKYAPKKGEPEIETTVLEKYSKDFRAKTGKPVEAEHCGRVNAETLKKFDAVLFFTTGTPLTKDELKDLIAWVKAGGAFCGTHCASDTLYGDAAYGHLIGGYFSGHPSGLQNIKVRVEDAKHPAAAGFEDGAAYKDEMYVFGPPRKDSPNKEQTYDRDHIRVILSIAAGSFDPGAKLARPDGDYAISWCREEGKGKVFYTSFGHAKDVWKDGTRFQPHLFGGLNWAVGRAKGDATPSGKK